MFRIWCVDKDNECHTTFDFTNKSKEEAMQIFNNHYSSNYLFESIIEINNNK